MANRVVRMRASPAVGIGGMYATGEGLDEIVRVAAMAPPFFERQRVSTLFFRRILLLTKAYSVDLTDC